MGAGREVVKGSPDQCAERAISKKKRHGRGQGEGPGNTLLAGTLASRAHKRRLFPKSMRIQCPEEEITPIGKESSTTANRVGKGGSKEKES